MQKREIVFLRHGEAEARKKEGDDLGRKLTVAGRDKIAFLGEFDLVVSSLAERAIETVVIAAGRQPDARIVPLSTHHWYGDWKGVEAVFINPGNISLRNAYLQADECQRQAGYAISRDAKLAVFSEIAKKGSPIQRILICGHTLFLQALAMEMITDSGDQDRILDIVLGEGEYFSIIA